MPFDYATIVSLYDSNGALVSANRSTFSRLSRDVITELREDVDLLGGLLAITGANWTNSKFNWTKGTGSALDTDKRLWLSYITDLRIAVEELRVKANEDPGTNIPAFDWTPSGVGVETADLKPLYDSLGDIIAANKPSYTDVRLKSLYETVRTALIAIADSRYLFADAVNGNDTTGDGSHAAPYKTWDKVVNVCNTTPGNIILMSGSYTVNTTTLTAANIDIVSAGTDLVTLNVPAVNPLTVLSDADNLNWRNIHFGNGTDNQWTTVDAGNTDISFTNCVFQGADDVGSACMTAANVGVTFNHCSFLGVNKKGTGFIQAIANNVIFNDCVFKGLDTCIKSSSGASAAVTMNYCGFYDFNTKTSGGATFTANNEFSTTLDPEILNNTYGYLSDTSPYIDQAADGTDIGAYPDSPYNQIRAAADTLDLAETSVETIIHTTSDSITVHEDLDTANMNISIDLALWGLFRSETTGVVTYYTANLINNTSYSAIMKDHVTNWEYNGATLDLSWDNTSGDLFDVHIAVDDGSTDYSPVAWWEDNALNPAATTTDTVGSRGYALSCFTDTELDEEWGDQGDFTTVTSDGVNDQQWDITLKIRIKNIVTSQWSEVVTLSKTYNFNTWEDTMYYLADNPRSVDGEYANHANYLAQAYHTGTTKYTRIDGVDWADDNRRYAYNPHVKSKHLIITKTGQVTPVNSNKVYEYWKDRWTGNFQPFGEANARAMIDLYPCVFSNYGNYNNGSHCFASSTNIINDNGSYESDVPIMGDSASTGSPSDVPYIFLTAYIGGDCLAHSSARGFYVWMPSGELLGHISGGWGDGANIYGDLFFRSEASSGGCPTVRFYLKALKAAQKHWWFTNAELKINEDNTLSTYKGFLKFNASHDADTPF